MSIGGNIYVDMYVHSLALRVMPSISRPLHLILNKQRRVGSTGCIGGNGYLVAIFVCLVCM